MIPIKQTSLVLIIIAFSAFAIIAQESYMVDQINLEGNHITKENIIYRELLFQTGDSVYLGDLEYKMEKSKENLLNTSLFNFVTITYSIENHKISFNIDLQERWYIWPYPVLEHADRNLSTYLNNAEWSRIDYGLFVLINNFRGRNEILKLKSIFGYNKSYELSYYNPYVNHKQTVGLGFDFKYVRNKELPYVINNNNLIYLRLNDEFTRQLYSTLVFFTYRPRLYAEYFAGLKYENVLIADSLLSLNQNYFPTQSSSLEMISFSFNYDYDARDSKIYPLKGFRFSSTLIKHGIGIFTNEGPFYVNSILEENMQLASRIYLNTSINGKLSFNNYNSFYFSEAIGFRNYIRGMEYYVSNGKNFYISKSNLKFEIFPQTKIDIHFLPTEKFSKAHYALYFNLFFDTGFVDSKDNIETNISNEFLYSGGIGLDFVTYYDKVLRIEYSLNKFGEHGIFFHLGAPIIN